MEIVKEPVNLASLIHLSMKIFSQYFAAVKTNVLKI